MKSIGIMQPYFFPYIGYFMYMNVCDKFILYNDVNFIMRGWIHRNKIIVNEQEKWIGVPLVKASPNKQINETLIDNSQTWKEKILSTIEHAFKKAPYYDEGMALIKRVLTKDYMTIDTLAASSIKEVHTYLELECELKEDSVSYHNGHLDREARLVDIMQIEQGNKLILPPGSVELYHPSYFNSRGLEVSFLKPEIRPYDRKGYFNSGSGLSIMDMIMFLSQKEIMERLNSYSLAP